MLIVFLVLATLSLSSIVFEISDRISNYLTRRALKRRVFGIFE